MRVSLKWLRDYLAYDAGAAGASLPPDEIARRLTMAGIEVTAVEKIGATWASIYVGLVLALHPHPNADRLQLVDVAYGRSADGQPQSKTVVTGAQNLTVGDKVPYATVGARLIDGHSDVPREMVLKPAKLRGIVSEGMVCSEKELGLSGENAGILILDPDLPDGLPLAEALGDAILDMDVTPNQVHCMSMLGTAQEVAALTGGRLVRPTIEYTESGEPADKLVSVETRAPDLCPRYTAAIIRGVKIGPSPRWLADRLVAAGQRPISNVVDVTNYVMLEMNQPLHAFDYDKVRGDSDYAHRIIVRRADSHEKFTTLDGVERDLTPEMLVIADGVGPVAVAGVMGGAESEVTDQTVNILIEAASFNPISIRRTARALRLPSDAARRFERGLPATQTAEAARRAVQLIQLTAGGQIAPGLADAYPAPVAPRQIVLEAREVERILGLALSTAEIASVLESLGFGVAAEGAEALTVTVPPYRIDVEQPADLIEDVIRILGYDRLPATMPDGPLPEPVENALQARDARLRDVLVGVGFAEIIPYTLTSKAKLALLDAGQVVSADALTDPLAEAVSARLAPSLLVGAAASEPLSIMNPLSSEWETLRTTAFVSLLEALRSNLRHEDRDVCLFELGKLYLPREADLPEERPVLTAIIGAYRSGQKWGAREEVDFFDLKGVAEVVLDRLGIVDCVFRPVRHPVFHSARAAAILRGPQAPGEADPSLVIGVVGEVSEEARRAFGVDERAYLLGIDLSQFSTEHAPNEMVGGRRYAQLARFPTVAQDVAVILPVGTPAEAVAVTIREAGRPLVRRVELFDVYQGDPIPAGSRSLAYHITYQSAERTLTDDEVARVHRLIEQALVEKLGAQLRA